MEGMFFVVGLWIVSAWVFYMIVKAAVRNGILEADAERARKARYPEAATFAKQVELERRLAESRAAFPDEPH
jgi:hypothetical protein